MDLSRYADLFLTESRDHLSAINHQLLELERAPNAPEPISAIFRAVHTLKGMSATMGYDAVAGLSHELETVLDGVRRGERVITPPVMDVLFEAADVLESCVDQVVRGETVGPEVATVIERLRAMNRMSGEFPVIADPTAAAPPMPSVPTPPTSPTPSSLSLRVRLAANAPLRGVRAFVVVKRAESLGRVLAVVPPVEALQAEQFERDFVIRLETDASPADVVAVLRSAGDVERVDVEDARARSAAEGTEGGRARGARNVRIDLRRLDALMNLIGELVITRGRLLELAMMRDDAALTDAVTEASRLVTDLQDQIMASRMVPVWQVFDRFPRLVRDSSRALGKQIEFTIEGKDIELDRSMLDEIGEPVVHLLRNAIDHGFEMPGERRAAGKPAAGKLVLSAARERSSITIRVTDDGRGIDRERVLKKARHLGLVDASRSELSDDELIRIISRPGFSTAESVTDISGRGVGIDAVHNRIRALGGSVEIRSVPGKGTTVALRLPLTLAILRALLVRVEGDTFAVPMTHVNETVELEASALKSVKGHEVLMLRDDVLPLVRFRSLLGLSPEGARMPQVIVLEVGERRAGLVVDELAGQRDIVVKQFDAVRNAAALFSGATILGDGAPALIVDVGSLL
ncbi:MAG TPA: chemotaxis protein CheA, partial [Gemmatimonadaceae bacterium]|nr:chemotaxis protein CheA [Gemmatimonadaceae bacterium]